MALVTAHVTLSGAVAAAFAAAFADSLWPAATHALIVGVWDTVVLATVATFAVGCHSPRASRAAAWIAPALTVLMQALLYGLNAISNASWGRNVTGHLVASFAPTVWSGREPFPVGAVGITASLTGAVAVALAVSWACASTLDAGVRSWLDTPDSIVSTRRWRRHVGIVGATAVSLGIALVLAVEHGSASEARPWKAEPVAGFFRAGEAPFEPTAHRHAVADRDAVLRATYPRHVSAARRKHVVVVVVDSLRADHMQAYGYGRPTTPFLSTLLASGHMQRVENAFSTCSESFCGITSTLSGREFRSISPRTFQLHDVLRDQGYQTRFLLSGNHRSWNGLPAFYRPDADMIFDGSQTERFTMDDDRLVLEALDRVPTASADRPTFFYVHLMSTHYLGVQFAESHMFTDPADRVAPGADPYAIRSELNKPDRYDDKVRQADGIIAQLFGALSTKGYLEDAVVVITADHGEGLGERHWAHGWHLYDEDIRIPLLLYDSAPADYGNLTFATQVDIAPTILDRLGLPIPESWDGRSLVDERIKAFSLHQTYFKPNRFAVLHRTGDSLFKYIGTPQYGEEELYDLGRDPGETHSLTAARPELTKLLREKVEAYREGR